MNTRPTIALLFPSGRAKTDWRIMAVCCAVFANRKAKNLPQYCCVDVHSTVTEHVLSRGVA